MSQLKMMAVVAVLAVLSPLPALAQHARVSPHETVSQRIDGNNMVTIVYGRPFSKDPKTGEVRKIWGTLLPYGKAWRLGADEATLLITQKPLQIGDTTVPAGAYTLYMVPDENNPKLAFSQSLGAWGVPVDEKHDLARVDLKKEPLDKPNDQLAIAIDKNSSGGGTIKIMWDDTQYSLPFTTKK